MEHYKARASCDDHKHASVKYGGRGMIFSSRYYFLNKLSIFSDCLNTIWIMSSITSNCNFIMIDTFCITLNYHLNGNVCFSLILFSVKIMVCFLIYRTIVINNICRHQQSIIQNLRTWYFRKSVASLKYALMKVVRNKNAENEED